MLEITYKMNQFTHASENKQVSHNSSKQLTHGYKDIREKNNCVYS